MVNDSVLARTLEEVMVGCEVRGVLGRKKTISREEERGDWESSLFELSMSIL